MKCEWNIFWKICWIPSWYFRTCWMVELWETCVNVHWFSTPWNSKKSPLEYTRSFLNVFCHTSLFAKGCLIISFVPHANMLFLRRVSSGNCSFGRCCNLRFLVVGSRHMDHRVHPGTESDFMHLQNNTLDESWSPSPPGIKRTFNGILYLSE